MKKCVLLFAIMVIGVSCASQRAVYQETSGRNIEPAHSIGAIMPFVANLELLSDSRQTYTESFEYEVTRQIVRKIEQFKQAALLNAAKHYNADTMVASLIDVDTNDKGLLVITVTGYPAKYSKFRSMTEQDIWIMRRLKETASELYAKPQKALRILNIDK